MFRRLSSSKLPVPMLLVSVRFGEPVLLYGIPRFALVSVGANVGKIVNLEVDILAKYVERLMGART